MIERDLRLGVLSDMTIARIDDDSLRKVARFLGRFSEEPPKRTPAIAGSPSREVHLQHPFT